MYECARACLCNQFLFIYYYFIFSSGCMCTNVNVFICKYGFTRHISTYMCIIIIIYLFLYNNEYTRCVSVCCLIVFMFVNVCTFTPYVVVYIMLMLGGRFSLGVADWQA